MFGLEDLSEEELKKIVKTMSAVLEKTLRKGDVYSYWNDTQILIMLHGAKEEYLGRIEMRIKENFYKLVSPNNCKLSIEFMPLASQQNIV
jgi:single-stranded DNA-specific DHH superfamily exonuclease